MNIHITLTYICNYIKAIQKTGHKGNICIFILPFDTIFPIKLTKN